MGRLNKYVAKRHRRSSTGKSQPKLTAGSGFFKREKKRKEEVNPCEKCGLYKKVKSPKMKATGQGLLGILLLGLAPGRREDEKGEQFIGETGQHLRKTLLKNNLSLERDFFKDNAVKCRTFSGHENRDPTNKELKLCYHKLVETVEEKKPKVIIAMGELAVDAIFSGVHEKMALSKWLGHCIPYQELGVWVIPVYHPSVVLYQNNVEHVFERELLKAIEMARERVNRPIFEDHRSSVELLYGFEEVKQALTRTKDSAKILSFDYETTGIKPYYSVHRIASVSFSTDGKFAFSFPMDIHSHNWNSRQLSTIKSLWKGILEDQSIQKIAHNIQMEERWSRRILGAETKNWYWDTLLYEHIRNENSSVSLKNMVYMRWGVSYGEEIKKYLESEKSSEINRIDEAPLEELLIYNGLDSLYTFKIFKEQRQDAKKERDNYRAYRFFHRGTLKFCDMEDTGLNVREEYFKKEERTLTREREKLEESLTTGWEAELYREHTGEDINPNSGKQLQVLLFKLLKFKPLRETKTGYSTDEETLASLKGSESTWPQDLIRSRKLKKMADYLSQFRRETVEGVLYTLFHLGLARTYRSSSSDPNYQNIPIRSEEAAKLLRSGFIPRPGCRIGEVDYSGMEVCIICCFSRDARLLRQLENKQDIHGMWCKKLGLDKQEENWGKARFDAKNSFVFPLFYLSWFKSVHKDLVSRGYDLEERVVQRAEEEFWEMYKGVKSWQQRLLDFYKRHGYAQMPFGHRRRGLLTPMKLVNAPVQGTAFHCLVWSLIRISEIAKEEGWKTKMPGQIHDSLIFDVYDPEWEHVKKTVTRVMTKEIREKNDWVISPLGVEWKISKTREEGGNWFEMEEIK